MVRQTCMDDISLALSLVLRESLLWLHTSRLGLLQLMGMRHIGGCRCTQR